MPPAGKARRSIAQKVGTGFWHRRCVRDFHRLFGAHQAHLSCRQQFWQVHQVVAGRLRAAVRGGGSCADGRRPWPRSAREARRNRATGSPAFVTHPAVEALGIVSASSRFTSAFSSSSLRSRFASDTSRPPYLAFQLQMVASYTPRRRAGSVVFVPASCSFNTPMTCFSVKLARFVRPSFHLAGS